MDVKFNPEYVELVVDRQVPDNIRDAQDQLISYEEVAIAVKQMKNQKCPGSSGIPIDFYKVFWSKMDMLKCAFESGSLGHMARDGIINLIPKVNRDSRLLKNFRPITLLNTEYKIIEKVLANRILPVLASLIDEDQRGFLPSRRISVNIRKNL